MCHKFQCIEINFQKYLVDRVLADKRVWWTKWHGEHVDITDLVDMFAMMDLIDMINIVDIVNILDIVKSKGELDVNWTIIE